jgi:hypothetical protein
MPPRFVWGLGPHVRFVPRGKLPSTVNLLQIDRNPCGKRLYVFLDGDLRTDERVGCPVSRQASESCL